MNKSVLKKVAFGMLFFVLIVFRPHAHVVEQTDSPRGVAKEDQAAAETSVGKDEMGAGREELTKTVRVNGVDVSHFQGQVDWQKVKADSISYVYLKATDGITYTDPKYIDNSSELYKVGLAFGSYHFFEPDDDPIDQAKHYISVTSQQKDILRPVLDVEISRGKTPQEISESVAKWLSYVEEDLNCQPIIYTYASYWEEFLGDDFTEYDLWLADYASTPNPPKNKQDWLMWQYSQKGKVNGISGMVDRDYLQTNNGNLSSITCAHRDNNPNLAVSSGEE